MKLSIVSVFGVALVLLSGMATAVEIDIPVLGAHLTNNAEPEEVVSAFKILGLLTVLSLVPAILVVFTSFTRIIVVLAMLRHAFGMPSTPPNTVLIALALFLTFFTMSPVIKDIEKTALMPYSEKIISAQAALDNVKASVKVFMLNQIREEDLAAVFEMSDEPKPGTIEDIGMISLSTAFLLSELQSAFQIGFVIFLPFLLIDLLVAGILMAMGMIMVPPLTISLPIKVLMFVLIEGWVLVAQSLIGSFH